MKVSSVFGCLSLAALCSAGPILSNTVIEQSEPTTGLRAIIIDGDIPRYTPIPLTSVDITSRLVNFVAEVQVTQTYKNVEENPIECEYMFPIEEGAAVTNFKVDLEGKSIVSKVQLNEKAEQEYNDAKSEGRTGFLVEEVRPDILQIKVGHLSPGATCTISLTYIMEADLDDGKVRLTIPTTISPKYVPKHDNTTVADKIKSIEYTPSSPAPMTFAVKALMKTKIEEVTSPSHQILTTDIGKKENNLYLANVQLNSSTTDLNKDIIVLVKSESANAPVVLHEENEESNVLMLSMVPDLLLEEDPKVDIVFLIDCSGSMAGSSIKLAKDALNILIRSLPTSVYFNIVRFGNSYESVFNSSVPYTDYNVGYANGKIEKMDADLGGTEILEPLKNLLQEETALPRRVFVLTDGSVSNSDEVLEVTRKYKNNKKVFALGIGSAADRYLVKGLARAGDGTSEFTVEGEIIAPKVIKQLKHSLQPNLNNININWGAKLDDTNSYQAPSMIPPLYRGSRTQVFKLLDKSISVPSKVKISANFQKNPFEIETYQEEIPVDVSSLRGNLLHQMFARKMIQDLEEQQVEDNAEIEERVTKLALKYQLMSKYTSFVAVDTEENKSSLALKSRNIPNQIPSGFHGLVHQSAYHPYAYAYAPASVMFKSSNSNSFSAPNINYAYDSYDYYDSEESFIGGDTSSPIDEVIDLISLQTTQGYFTKSEKIFKILELAKEDVEKIAGDADEETFYTLLVITALEQRFKDLKSSWELVGEKAERYLQKQQIPTDLKQKIVSLL